MDLIQIQSNTVCIYVIVYRSCDTLNINYYDIIPKITELIINYKWCEIDTLGEQRVMLNYDLAVLYEVETKYLNLAVKRNLKRFPYDFMFHLTKVEWENLRLQFANSNESLWLQNESLKPKRGGSRYLPYAFTEQGLAMLSGILNSEKAIEVNINIMRAFVMIRTLALTYKELSERLKVLEEKFPDVYKAINYLLDKDKNETKQKELKLDLKNKYVLQIFI